MLLRDESLADEFVGSQHVGIDCRPVSCGEHEFACSEPQGFGEQPDFRFQESVEFAGIANDVAGDAAFHPALQLA